MNQVTKTDKYTGTTETRVKIFWQFANDSTKVTRSCFGAEAQDFSFTVIDNNFLLWNHESILDQVYADQGNNPRGTKVFECQHSLSVGDVIQITQGLPYDDFCTIYIVAPVGFVEITSEQFTQWRKTSQEDRSWFARKIYKEGLQKYDS
jgi:hypothetical protein